MADVFISYNKADLAIARQLAAAIEAEGLSAWIDRKIKPGDIWRAEVQRQLADMHCMVVIWTANSVRSDHVIEEAAEGKAERCLIPVMVGDCQLPYGFKEIQTVQLQSMHDPDCAAAFSRVAGRAKELVSLRPRAGNQGTATPPAAAGSALPLPGRTANPPHGRRHWLLASAGAGVLGAGGLAAWLIGSKGDGAPPPIADPVDLGPPVPTTEGEPLGTKQQLRIAFTAAMHLPMFPAGDIWRQIREAQPDLLLILGNAMFLDAMPLPGQQHPRDMSDVEFQAHVFARWSGLLQHADFRALAQSTPIELVLGSQDYLWDGHAAENATREVRHAQKVASSRAVFQHVRAAVSQRLTGDAFPAAATAAALWAKDPPPPGYRHRTLNADTVLHLPDFQTLSSARSLLGAAQRAAIEAVIQRRPDAVHLLASPYRLGSDASPSWSAFDDAGWLRALAFKYRIAVLSGADHVNQFRPGQRDRLINANASGAAVCKLVTVGAKCRNHALLDLDADSLAFSFFAHGAPDNVGEWRVNRSDWTAAQGG